MLPHMFDKGLTRLTFAATPTARGLTVKDPMLPPSLDFDIYKPIHRSSFGFKCISSETKRELVCFPLQGICIQHIPHHGY